MGRAEDRISYLPDAVLQSILTMLPLKSAIRTDVLSKKWRNLWKYSLSTATALEFGEEFANNQSAKDFVETVNRYISQNDSKKLERFRIFFSPFDLFASEIVSWISFATGKGVRYLDIDLSQGFRDPADGEFIDGRSLFELPSSLFDCDLLIDLRVSRCLFFTPLNLSNFGGLQSLSISHSNINDEMLQTILTECSLLESLSLRNCQQLDVISITVPDLKLKRLTIGNCCSTNLLEIDAPKLQSFHIFGRVCFETRLSNLFSLEDAAIYSSGGFSEPDYFFLLTIFISALVHLFLIDYQKELQNLHELQLVLTSMTDEDLNLLYTFFYSYSSPFLGKLFILLPTHIDDPNEEKYGVLVLNLLSLDDISFDHLKMIKVTNFKGSRNEMGLVSFLLEKAAIFETMVLVLPAVKEGNGKERLVLRILRGQVLLLRKHLHALRLFSMNLGKMMA